MQNFLFSWILINGWCGCRSELDGKVIPFACLTKHKTLLRLQLKRKVQKLTTAFSQKKKYSVVFILSASEENMSICEGKRRAMGTSGASFLVSFFLLIALCVPLSSLRECSSSYLLLYHENFWTHWFANHIFLLNAVVAYLPTRKWPVLWKFEQRLL